MFDLWLYQKVPNGLKARPHEHIEHSRWRTSWERSYPMCRKAELDPAS